MNKITLILVALFINQSIYGQSLINKIDSREFLEVLPGSHKLNVEQVQNYSNTEYSSILINEVKSDDIFKNTINELHLNNFPVSKYKTGNLLLRRSRSVLAENAKTIIKTEDREFEFSEPELDFFEGEIEGDKGSKVFIINSKGNLFGSIIHSDGTLFSLSPILNHKFNNSCLHNLLLSGSKKDMENIKLCGLDNSIKDKINTNYFNKGLVKLNENLQKSDLLEVKLVLEATFEYQDLFKVNNEYDTTKARDYLISIIAMASKIYEEYVNVTFSIIEITMFYGTDPYIDGKYLQDKLILMPDARERPADRTLTVLFANLDAQPDDTPVAGISFGGEPYVGSLCNDRYSYCVLGIKGDGLDSKKNLRYPTFDITWDVTVACHEMGHNFSCPHTHDPYWKPAIDTCVCKSMNMGLNDIDNDYNGPPIARRGTIMSYCHIVNDSHNVELIFHNKMLPLMRSAVTLHAPCVKAFQEPVIKLLHPLGQKKYIDVTEINIRWTSQHVTKVDLSYSIDDGNSWQSIIKGHNAHDTVYKWELPMVSSKYMLVKITSSSDPAINDVSILRFEISPSVLLIESPKEGDQYGHLSVAPIKWETNMPGTVKIEYSDNGGNKWTTIKTGVNGSLYNWEIPDNITSDDVIVKITNESNPDLFAFSGKFSIGAEWAEIIYPNLTSDSLCIDPVNDWIHIVKYNHKNLSKIFLLTSYDDGKTWVKNSLLPLVATGEIEWKVRGEATKNVWIKIVPAEDVDLTLDMNDEPLILYYCLTSAENEILLNDEFSIVKIIPNPAYDKVTIEIEYNSNNIIIPKIRIVDLLGNEVFRFESNKSITYGKNYIELNLPVSLSTGSYYINFIINSTNLYCLLKILK